jgi:hypothetical protein
MPVGKSVPQQTVDNAIVAESENAKNAGELKAQVNQYVASAKSLKRRGSSAQVLEH